VTTPRATYRQTKTSRIRAYVCLTLALILSVSCNDSVNPFTEETGENPFYIYGYLDTAADTQFVRIQAVRPTPLPVGPGEKPERVLSTNVRTGETVSWRDSLTTLENDSLAFLYYALFSPRPGDLYTLEAVASDGASTLASTTLPPLLNLDVDAPVVDAGQVAQRIVWRGLRNAPYEATIFYLIGLPNQDDREVAISYENAGSFTSEGWVINLDLDRDASTVRRLLGLQPTDRSAKLCGIRMQIARLSDDWTASTARGNVTNGFGFFGSITRFSVPWMLETDVVRELGLQPCPEN